MGRSRCQPGWELPAGGSADDDPARGPGRPGTLFGGALGIAVMSLADTIFTASAFAARTGQEVPGNQEMIGIGAANLAAGLFQGFPVSTSGSRTAVAERSGAKTQLTGVTGSHAPNRPGPRYLPASHVPFCARQGSRRASHAGRGARPRCGRREDPSLADGAVRPAAMTASTLRMKSINSITRNAAPISDRISGSCGRSNGRLAERLSRSSQLGPPGPSPRSSISTSEALLLDALDHETAASRMASPNACSSHGWRGLSAGQSSLP